MSIELLTANCQISCSETGSRPQQVQVSSGTRNFRKLQLYLRRSAPKQGPNVCLCDDVRTLFSLIKLAGPCFGALRRRYSCNSRKRPQFLIGSKIPDSRFRKKVDQKMSARCELLNSRISVHADMGKFRAKREIC